MSQEDDKVFVRNFSMIIILLVVFTIAMALVGNHFNNALAPADNPSRQANLENRLQSPAAVNTGNQPQAVAQVVAPAADVDGATVYQNACAACHSIGAAGAPKLEAASWTERLPKGEDILVDNAINGINAMPPKGGQLQLSDAEVRAAVEYMLAQF